MNPLQLLEDPLRSLLDFLHENANLTYGWSIVVLTVIVRTALLPLVIKQYSSMRSMQMVAPQLKELQRKYKGNRQKLNEELMRFYKENEINPFASCLPLVAQLPIFIALYYVLREFSEEAVVGSGASDSLSFMWVIPDIRLELTEIGWGAAVIVAIYAISQLLSTELSATPNMPESQRRIMRILPVVVVIFVFQFPVPSGLVLYWMTTNLWTAGQQLVMRHRIGLHLADPDEVEKFNSKNPPPQQKKGSRTPPRAETAGVAALTDGEEDATGDDDEATTPVAAPRRRRRRGGTSADEPVTTPEPDDAGEALDAPEATEAPEAVTAPEPEEAPVAPSNGTGGNGAAGNRRQPRPKGQGGKGPAKGSRPAQARSKKKKR
ncbi:YidC/Oxa1 family membrane protein insertase [Miltoncostaea oceani]|uniref:YidC/Oxa1 family membrane protein insertase n=1 Tax=Miltoncostaea oceani TaxID=2843216 RepID=UPI001C3C44ED|nr:YidC/Oxa1 family membrane protein insertase [Miltoncostaea oceani]